MHESLRKIFIREVWNLKAINDSNVRDEKSSIYGSRNTLALDSEFKRIQDRFN